LHQTVKIKGEPVNTTLRYKKHAGNDRFLNYLCWSSIR